MSVTVESEFTHACSRNRLCNVTTMTVLHRVFTIFIGLHVDEMQL